MKKLIVADNKKHICFVTEELSGIGGSGGIGAAFFELAKLLSASGASVDVLYCPVNYSITNDKKNQLIAEFLNKNIKLFFLDPSPYVELPYTTEKKSYAVAQWLLEKPVSYDYIHFHDYKGLGFFSTGMKRQGLGLKDSIIVTQLHGPTRWTIETNKTFFIHEDQLKIDFMEKQSIAQADIVVSPSAYLVQWLKDNKFNLPSDVRVIKNVCSDLNAALNHFKRIRKETSPVSDLIFFARHEDRKGFAQFCDTLDLVNEQLTKSGVTVTFLGKFGSINSQPSGIYLIDRAKKWKFNIAIRSGYSRNEAIGYISSKSSPLILIPSPVENSPYTVLESIMLGLPIISSSNGGGPELFDNSSYEGLCEINPQAIANKIIYALANGISVPVPSETIEQIEQKWLNFHEQTFVHKEHNLEKPLVTFAITHYERTKKLVDAIFSVMRQTYSNIEILVIDDGSKKKESLADLEKIEVLLARVGARLIRQENGYLGAARNCAIRNAQGKYICFLDDDDIAKPELIQTLVTAAESTGADVVNCMNIFMDEKVRGEVLAQTSYAPSKVSYVPLGGPLALTPTENCLGAATALFKKSALIDIGCYSELKGVGHEDYELFIKLVQAGKHFIIAPKALYYYEVGRPSMLSRTSLITNFRRCFDALDLASNVDEWKDFIDLQVGKQTITNSHNRQYWLYSQSQNNELRLKVLTQNMDRTDMLKCLIELAHTEGADHLHLALHDDLEPNEVYSSDQYEFVKALVVGKKPSFENTLLIPKMLEDHVLNAQFDMVLNRYEDAVVSISNYISKSKKISLSDINFIKQLIEMAAIQNVSANAWQVLKENILIAYAPKSQLDAINAIIINLSILSDDVDSAYMQIKNLLPMMEQEYLNQNLDVAASVSTDGFVSGLDHYLQCGKIEGRQGYFVLTDVFELSKTSIQMDGTVQELFGMLVNNKAN